MTFTLSDRKHLEIMAKLSSKSPAKPTQISQEIPEVQPASFTEKLLSLTAKLRTQGFTSYASSLESKFINLKTADTQDSDLLYRAHTETGDDLIEFAHPDGDTEMCPASDHLGDVETQLSQHKKILEVIQKDPSKKKVSKAQIDPSKVEVDLETIANKFKYFYEYIEQNFLHTQDISGDANIKEYYNVANIYFVIGQKLYGALNHPGSKSAEVILQVIKSALQNTVAKQEQFNSLDDIDRFRRKILSWLEDNNPVKKAELIGMVKKALAPTMFWPIELGAYLIWKHLGKNVIDVSGKIDKLLAEIKDVKDKEVIKKLPRYKTVDKQTNVEVEKTDLDYTIDALFAVKNQNQKLLTEGLGLPEQKNIILTYQALVNELIPKLDRLDRLMDNAENLDQQERGRLETAYRMIIDTDFKDVKDAIVVLKTTLEKQAEMIKGAGKQESKPTDLQNTQKIEENSAKIQEAINQLKSWENSIQSKPWNEAQKKPALEFITQQIKDLQSLNPSNEQGLTELIVENKKFNDTWKP